ncbi:hypothetical protein JZ785_14555 [Alicyclobacillus curvatus]|nr:hypothetical protein JZ785_14555 [Alicyclobacillus curvatus]
MTKHVHFDRPHPYSLLAGLISWILIAYQARDFSGAITCFIAALGLQVTDALAAVQSPRANLANPSGRRHLRAPQLSAGIRKLFAILVFSLPIMVIYVVVQATLTASVDGGKLLWQGPTIPAFGTLALSTKSLIDSIVNGLRLWSVLLGVMAVVHLIQPDDVIVWLGRRFARAGLTISMMMNFLPLMQQEYSRLREYVWVRGQISGNASWLTRLRATGAVLQALLMNALERSWSLAESMHTRGYGSRARSFYRRPHWTQPDTWLLVGFVAADIAGFMLGTSLGMSIVTQTGAWRWLFSFDVAFVFSMIIWMGGNRRANPHSA